jgi:DNA-binding beta-propeller fold protein YncE
VLFVLTAASDDGSAQTADVLVVDKIRSNANLQGDLAFLDLASGKVVADIPVGKEPGNSLSVIDVAARKEIRRVDLGPLWNPHGLLASRGLFYFTAEGARAIGAYDPVKDQVVWIMGTGQDQTHMLAATRDGSIMVATNRGSNTLSIFELTGKDPLAAGAWKVTLGPVGQRPEGVDISPDGTQAWVGCRGGNEITIVDLAQKKSVDSFPTLTQSVARVRFAAGGRHALIGVTNADDVAEVDLQTMTVVRRIKTGQGPDAMAWIGK